LALRSHRFKLALVALIAAVALLGSTPSSRAQSCITTLPLSWSLSSHYAASWTRSLDLFVHSNGPRITGLSVSLSTFDGHVLGSGSLKYALTGGAVIHMKLLYPLQPGTFSLYFYGFPNADPSCGPKHRGDTVRFSGCTGELPVRILNATEGSASDYGNYYSFDVAPTGGELLRGLAASLSTFRGRLVGTTTIPVLFGQLHVSIPLRTGIAPLPTKYTLDVSGYTGGRPASCGPLQQRKTLEFQ
jgi:hypothetical protein